MARNDKRYGEIWNIIYTKKSLVEKLIVNKALVKLWTYLIVDLITKLPLAARKDTILVVYDRLFKMMYFAATMKETSVGG